MLPLIAISITFRGESKDLNSKNNRIPFVKELSTLRHLASHNARMRKGLESELASAETVRDEIEQREHKLLLKLESVRSELQASNRLVQILKDQQTTLDVEQQRLAGLIHPIRRCPTDILSVIFEWSVLTGTTRMCKTALDLSHVCRRWRSIAHETPDLWVHIYIPECALNSDIPALWDHVTAKIRSIPPRFTFRVWNTTPPHTEEESDSDGLGSLEALSTLNQSIRFNDCDRIGLLRFELPATLTDHLLMNDIHYDGVVDCIEISVEPVNPARSWDLAEILTQYPAARQVRVMGASQVTSNVTANLDAVTTLELVQIKSMGIIAKLARFKNLHTLELLSIDCRGDPVAQDLVLEALQVLKVEHFEKIPWQRIKTPMLLEFLALGVQHVHKDIISFIACNQTIRHILISISEEQFRMFALAAPQLKSLDIAYGFRGLYDWVAIGLDTPPFPHLCNLVVVAYDLPDLKHFDALVATRCSASPMFLTDSGLTDQLDTISMRLFKADLRGRDWKQLPSLAECSVTQRYPPEMWEPEWVDCVFSWERSNGSEKVL